MSMGEAPLIDPHMTMGEAPLIDPQTAANNLLSAAAVWMVGTHVRRVGWQSVAAAVECKEWAGRAHAALASVPAYHAGPRKVAPDGIDQILEEAGNE